MIKAVDDLERRFLRQARQHMREVKQPAPPFVGNKPGVHLEATDLDNLSPLSVSTGLEPFEGGLDRRKAAHLLRRTGFGAPIQTINEIEGQSAVDVVDRLVDQALDAVSYPVPPEPAWANEIVPFNGSQEEIDAFFQNNIMWLRELQNEWLSTMIKSGLRERMTLIWHNHFVTQYEVYFLAMHAYRYLKLLRNHAFGNVKEFVRAIGKDPAMLEYLNGNTSISADPNENYARELLELFTMGPEDKDGNDNYTQQDIEEIARALTGWTIDYINHVGVFAPERFDSGVKSFLGRTGPFGYDDVVDIIFEERGPQTAYFICSRIYRAFVYAVPNPVIVQELADLMISHDYEIAPVVRTLLKSAHFFDDQVVGAHIMSPIDLLAGFPNEAGLDLGEEAIELLKRVAAFLEQNLLNPPNVAGWPGYRSWISTMSLPIRWLLMEFLIFGEQGTNLLNLVPVVRQMPEASDPLAAFKLPVALAAYFVAVPVESLDIGNVTDEFGGDLASHPIPEEISSGPAYVQNLAKIFLAGLPWYEWSLESEQTPLQLAFFARFLTRLPEFHLG